MMTIELNLPIKLNQHNEERNPKMVNIYKSLGAQPSRQMVTYRYIFNENQHPFERHPEMDYSAK